MESSAPQAAGEKGGERLADAPADRRGADPAAPPRPSGYKLASLALMLCALGGSLAFGLLPMLFGLLGARAASVALAESRLLAGRGRLAKAGASLAVAALAFGLCGAAAAWIFQSGQEAVKEAPALARKLTAQARELRASLPEAVAAKIPQEDAAMQQAVADAIGSQMPGIAGAGKSWAGGALFALVGWIVGLLMANMEDQSPSAGPLAKEFRCRARKLSELFGQIVVGQFFVACANTFFAAIFMYVALPLAGVHMPWAAGLLALTLALSMIPAAGNVMCNGAVTLVALSVGPGVALSALGYLVLVHKAEYFINARIVGRRVSSTVWEMLLAMFAMEAVFGVGGLVAAPLFYAYVKSELRALGWI